LPMSPCNNPTINKKEFGTKKIPEKGRSQHQKELNINGAPRVIGSLTIRYFSLEDQKDKKMKTRERNQF